MLAPQRRAAPRARAPLAHRLATGRLLEFTCSDSADAATGDDGKAPATSVGEGCRLSFQANAFSRRIKRIHRTGGDYANDFDANRPISSLCGFLFDQEDLWKVLFRNAENQQALQGLRLLRVILGRHVLDAVDELAVKFSEECSGAGEFPIPNDSGAAPGLLFDRWTANGVAIAGNKLFPYRSWPWTLTRESALVWAKQGKYTGSELQRLYESKDNGPLCCLAAAWLSRAMGVRAWHMFAAKGLEKLSVEDFRKDCHILFEQRMPLGQSLRRLAELLRKLDEKEVTTLTSSLPLGQALLFGARRGNAPQPSRTVAGRGRRASHGHALEHRPARLGEGEPPTDATVAAGERTFDDGGQLDGSSPHPLPKGDGTCPP